MAQLQEQLVGRIQRMLTSKLTAPVIVGITGPPGAGKSEFARAVVQAMLPPDTTTWMGTAVAHIPMDGFHLADAELNRLGRRDRKGAPDTFDPAGYVAVLRRIAAAEPVVYAPDFGRELEQPLAGALPVFAGTRLIVTEGNYLLLSDAAWSPVRPLLDEVWYLAIPEQLRLARLVARHQRFGKSAAAAQAWANGPDQRNAEVVEATRADADVIIWLQERERR